MNDRQEQMGFGNALEMLKSGECEAITRSDWYSLSNPVIVKLQKPDEFSKMTESYLYMEKYVQGKTVRFPLTLSCESLLADTWMRR